MNATPPVELWLELETRCNLSCPFCYNYWKDGIVDEPRRASTAETLSGLTTLLSEVNCRTVAVSGGEPLLRSDLLDIVSVIRVFDAAIVLTTNGLLLNEERLKRLIAAGVKHFQIPLHSLVPEVHDLLSGATCWKKSLRSILLVQESPANVTPVFVATGLNVHHFADVVDLWARLGLRRVIFNRFIPSGAGSVNSNRIGVPSDEALIRALDAAHSRAERYGFTIELGVPIEVSMHKRAGWPNIKMASCPVSHGQRRWTVGSDLTLRRCNHSAVNIGSISSGGLRDLVSDLGQAESCGRDADAIHPCQYLKPDVLVQVSVLGTTG